MREAVGPSVEILVEAHRRLAPNEAIRMANELEEFEPFWYEEPIDAEDVDGLAEVRRRISAAGGDRRSAVQQKSSSPKCSLGAPRTSSIRMSAIAVASWP